MNQDNHLSIEWGVALSAQPGQSVSGDGYVVESFPEGRLLAVIDGLGHGPKASEAARAAEEALRIAPHEQPDVLLQRCHRRLAGTRGAVISLASFNAQVGTMTWTGVGTVTAVFLQKNVESEVNRDYLMLRGGIVGFRLPPLRSFIHDVYPGDLLILATDGIRKGFIEDIPIRKPAQVIADYVHQTFNRLTDDALVLVARFTHSPD